MSSSDLINLYVLLNYITTIPASLLELAKVFFSLYKKTTYKSHLYSCKTPYWQGSGRWRASLLSSAQASVHLNRLPRTCGPMQSRPHPQDSPKLSTCLPSRHGGRHLWVPGPDLEEWMELENVLITKQELLVDIQHLWEELSKDMKEVEGLESNEGSKTLQQSWKWQWSRRTSNMDPKRGSSSWWRMNFSRTHRGDWLFPGQWQRPEQDSHGTKAGVVGWGRGLSLVVLYVFMALQVHWLQSDAGPQAISMELPVSLERLRRLTKWWKTSPSDTTACSMLQFYSPQTCAMCFKPITLYTTSLYNPNIQGKWALKCFVTLYCTTASTRPRPAEDLRHMIPSVFLRAMRMTWSTPNSTLTGRASFSQLVELVPHRHCFYFEYTTHKEQRGIIISQEKWTQEVNNFWKLNCFRLYIPKDKKQPIKACKTEADVLVVEGDYVVYWMSVPTQEEKDK